MTATLAPDAGGPTRAGSRADGPSRRTGRRRAGPPGHRRRRAPTPRALVAALATLAACAVYAYSFAGHYADDAYITMRYAQNLAETGVWGFNPGAVSNSATSPLNVALQAAATALLGDVVRAVVLLTALELTALTLLLAGLSRRLLGGPVAGVLAAVALAANPLVFSSIGLEGLLYAVGLVAALALLLARRWSWLAVVLALVTLTRADGAVLTAVVAGAVALLLGPHRATLGVLARGGLVYLAVQLPWYAFSWAALGGVVPDTLVLKQAQNGSWADWGYADGLAMWWQFDTLAVLGTFVLLPLAVVLLRRPGPGLRLVGGVLAGYAVLHYLAYSAVQVPPYNWYYLHQAVPAVLLGALGAGVLLARSRPRWRPLVAAAVVALLALPVGALARTWSGPLPYANWATPERYVEIGREVAALTPPDATIALRGETGTVALVSGRRVISDDGLTDRDTASRIIAEQIGTSGPLRAELLRLSTSRRPPPGPAADPDYRMVWLRSDPDAPPVDPVALDAARLPPDEPVVRRWQIGSSAVPEARVYLLRVR